MFFLGKSLEFSCNHVIKSSMDNREQCIFLKAILKVICQIVFNAITNPGRLITNQGSYYKLGQSLQIGA